MPASESYAASISQKASARPRQSSRRSVRPVTVRFGAPIDVSRHGTAASGRARRAATDEIMAAIHALSGQELANAYNELPPHGALARIADRVAPRERV